MERASRRPAEAEPSVQDASPDTATTEAEPSVQDASPDTATTKVERRFGGVQEQYLEMLKQGNVDGLRRLLKLSVAHRMPPLDPDVVRAAYEWFLDQDSKDNERNVTRFNDIERIRGEFDVPFPEYLVSRVNDAYKQVAATSIIPKTDFEYMYRATGALPPKDLFEPIVLKLIAGYPYKYQRVKKYYGIPIDYTSEPFREEVLKKYQSLLPELNVSSHGLVATVDMIEGLYDITGVRPEFDPARVQMAYAVAIKGGDTHDLKAVATLHELTGIPAEMSEDVVRARYDREITKVNPNDAPWELEKHARTALKIRELTGVPLPPEVAEKVVELHMRVRAAFPSCYRDVGMTEKEAREAREARVRAIAELKAAPETMVAVYGIEAMWKLDAKTHKKIQHEIAEQSGVPLTPELVQDIYVVLLAKNGPDPNYHPDILRNVRDATGIAVASETVQRCYRKLADNKDDPLVVPMVRIAEATGERIALPRDLMNQTVRAICQSQSYSLKKFLSFSATPLDPEVVRLIYDEDISAGAFGTILDLYEYTKIKPRSIPKETIEDAFVWYLKNEMYEELREFASVAGIELDDAGIFREVMKRNPERARKVAQELFLGQQAPWESLGPNVAADVYASAVAIPNKDLGDKAWHLLTGFKGFEFVTKDEMSAFEKTAPETPPFLRAIAGIKQANVQSLEPINRVYAEAAKRKAGGAARAERLTFSLVHFYHLAPPEYVVALDRESPRLFEGASTDDVADVYHRLASYFLLAKSLNVPVLRAPEPSEMPTLDIFRSATKTLSETLFEQTLGVSVALEKIARVEEEWGDIRPLLVLSAKYQDYFKSGMPLFRDAVQAIFDGRWDEFRNEHKDAKELLKGLTREQQERWTRNLEAMSLAEARTTTREAERQNELVREAIERGMNDGHLYGAQSPETAWAHDVYLWTRNALKETKGYSPYWIRRAREFVGLELYRRTTLPGVLKELGADEAALLRTAQAKLEDVQQQQAVKDTSALKSQAARMEKAIEWATDVQKLAEHRARLTELVGLTGEMGPKELAAKRADLMLAERIVRVGTLTAEEIRANAIKGGDGKLARGMLSKSLEELEQDLMKRKSAFAQDIANVRELLRGTGSAVSFEGLVIVESDHPKTLFETGKYPSGSGSCQNYEGSGLNRTLLAYVVDPDKKHISVRKPDGAQLARAMVKLVWVDDKQPALFIEPTYTSVNKADKDFDPDIDAYVRQKAAELGGIPVLRAARYNEVKKKQIRVTVRASRNHFQYEDNGLGTAEGEYRMNAIII